LHSLFSFFTFPVVVIIIQCSFIISSIYDGVFIILLGRYCSLVIWSLLSKSLL
jgi:hypothetical protein